MRERRIDIRRRTYLGGRIVFNYRQSATDCLLRNMGERGAKLEFDHPVLAPDEFDVQLARHERVIRARVAWRGRTELGVTFDRAAWSGNVVPLDAAIRERRMAAERAELRRRIAELGGAD